MSGGEEKKEAERRGWTHSPGGRAPEARLQAEKGAGTSFRPPQGSPRAWDWAKGGRQAVSSGETRPLLLGGRAGTCLDPSEPMGKM